MNSDLVWPQPSSVSQQGVTAQCGELSWVLQNNCHVWTLPTKCQLPPPSLWQPKTAAADFQAPSRVPWEQMSVGSCVYWGQMKEGPESQTDRFGLDPGDRIK
jgi:hypothetical protein